MISPLRTLALAPNQTARRGWLGVTLSTLCFLHCIGGAALVPLLPTAFAFLAENEVIEWALLGIAAALAARSCWAGPARRVRTALWAAATGAGIASLFLERETLLRVALAALALLQLWRVLAGGNVTAPRAE